MARPLLARTLIIVAVLAVFGRLCVSEFTWFDDHGTIHHNPALNPPSIGNVAHYWTAIGRRAPLGLYMPLTYTVWSGLAWMTYVPQPDDVGIHLDARFFHTANVLLHAMSALVVLSILRILIGQLWPAAVGALLFALHPVQVEAVGWISGMKDVLAGLLGLIALRYYILHVRSSSVKQYALATLALIAAMLAKPSAMVVPLAAIVIDLLVIKSDWRCCLNRQVVWAVLVLLCIINVRLAQPASDVPTAALWARPLIAMDVLAFYMWKLVWPVHLGVDYGRMPLRVIEHGWLWYMWLAPAVLFAMIWRNRMLFTAGLLFVAGVLPVLGFVPFLFQQFSGVADHYLYFAMLGPALAAAYLVSLRPSPAVAVASAILIVILGLLSFRQAAVWHDDFSLWQQAVSVNPNSMMGRMNRGSAYYRRRELDLARQDFDRAIEISPKYALAHDSLGMVFMARGEYSRAADEFRAALVLDPSLESARTNLQIAESSGP